MNPLREILTAQLDFERLRAACPVKLFLAATHVNSGRLRLFRETEVSADTLLASACLPSLHRPVEIDGEHYWDGAYSANPAIFPLFYECDADDLMLVLLSPSLLGQTPQTREEVDSRSLDLAFNAAFLREMDAFSRCREQASRDWLPLGRLERRLLRARIHLIEAEALTSGLPKGSRLTTSLSFLEMLRERGKAEAHAWLAAHRDDIGRQSSVDIRRRFG